MSPDDHFSIGSGAITPENLRISKQLPTDTFPYTGYHVHQTLLPTLQKYIHTPIGENKIICPSVIVYKNFATIIGKLQEQLLFLYSWSRLLVCQ